jgi:RimJ/RimL family protein N-acetyltransferase
MQNANISLKPWTRADRSACISWPDPQIPPHWRMNPYAPTMRESWGIWYENQLVGRGTYSIVRPDPHNHRISLFLHRDWWGKGIGRMAINELVGLAEERTMDQIIRADCATTNQRSIAAFVAAGFSVLAFFRYGDHDYVKMGKSHAAHHRYRAIRNYGHAAHRSDLGSVGQDD